MATWSTTGISLKGAKGDTGDPGPMWQGAYTIPYASTITPNCNNGYDQRCTLTGNPTVALATNPTDTQYLLLWFYASGADRTVTLNSSYETSQPVPGRVFTIPSGTWGSVLCRRRGSTWVLMAAYPQPIAPVATPIFRAVQTVTQSMTSNTRVAVTFSTEVVDTHNGHSTVSNTDRYVCQVAGWYMVSGVVSFSASTTTGTRLAEIQKNGVTVDGSGTWQGGQTVPGQRCVVPATLIPLSVGDYVTIVGYCGGITLNTEASTSSLDVAWIRDL